MCASTLDCGVPFSVVRVHDHLVCGGSLVIARVSLYSWCFNTFRALLREMVVAVVGATNLMQAFVLDLVSIIFHPNQGFFYLGCWWNKIIHGSSSMTFTQSTYMSKLIIKYPVHVSRMSKPAESFQILVNLSFMMWNPIFFIVNIQIKFTSYIYCEYTN